MVICSLAPALSQAIEKKRKILGASMGRKKKQPFFRLLVIAQIAITSAMVCVA